MTDEDRKKGESEAEASPQEETAETTEMPATEADQAPGHEAEAGTHSDTGTEPGENSDRSGRLKVIAASAAAVVVALLLFIAPGDRVLGFESDGHDMERSHDDHGYMDDDGPGMDDRGDFDDYEDYGPGGMHGGGYGGPAMPPPPASPQAAPPQAAPSQPAPPAAPQGDTNNR